MEISLEIKPIILSALISKEFRKISIESALYLFPLKQDLGNVVFFPIIILVVGKVDFK